MTKVQSILKKQNAAKLSPIITTLYNRILATGEIPEHWKRAFLIPIPKKGDTQDVSNYRGIALQAVLTKFFDVLLTNLLTNRIKGLLPRSQHGFIKRRSTISNLLQFTQYTMDQLHRKHEVHSIYFDFSKAFDSVNHIVLAEKLAKIDTPLQLLKTIIRFISYRKYALKVDGGRKTDFLLANSSVPQGSNIGPALFLVMMMDIDSCLIGNCQLLAYADDVKIFCAIENQQDFRNLQSSIDRLDLWSKRNKILIYVKKL